MNASTIFNWDMTNQLDYCAINIRYKRYHGWIHVNSITSPKYRWFISPGFGRLVPPSFPENFHDVQSCLRVNASPSEPYMARVGLSLAKFFGGSRHDCCYIMCHKYYSCQGRSPEEFLVDTKWILSGSVGFKSFLVLEVRWLKIYIYCIYIYISAILLFTLSFFSLRYRFTGFRHAIRIKQTWRGSCTCGSHWEITLGPTCWTQLRICLFPLWGGISMAEWSVGDGGWSWFRVIFVIVFVIVLCHVDSPNPRSVGHTSTWSIHTNARGASAAAS